MVYTTAMASDLPEPLRGFIQTHFDVELFWQGWHEGIRRYFETFPERTPLIRQQLADLILAEDIDLELYRSLTNHRFSDAVKLTGWLRELWGEMFGDAPIPGDR